MRVPVRPTGDDGNGVVEFVLVTVLLLALFLVVAQVGVALHTRNVLVAAAAEGARYGANADRTPEQGAQRALQVVGEALSGDVASSAAAVAVLDDPRVVDVRVTASLPVLFLSVGPLQLTVHGHAYEEAP